MTETVDLQTELPVSWTQAEFSDCVDILDSRRVPINNKERQERISGKLEADLFPYYGATGQVGWINDYIFDRELVLLGEDGVPFLDWNKPKAYLINGKTWVNNHAHVLRAMQDVTSNKFILYFLNQFDFYGYVTGTTRLKLNQARMREIPIPLPPLNEQRRIVEKIEELFTKLDAGVRSLEQAQAQLKSYRRSVLKAAVEGELSREWREAHRDELEPASELLERILRERREKWEASELAKMVARGKSPKNDKWKARYKAPKALEANALPEPSATWTWTNFEQLAQDKLNALKAGPFGSALKKSYYVPDGYKIYGQEQVLRGDAHYGDYYIDEKRYRSLESCAVVPGDLLISLVGTIGRVLILPDNIESGIINPRLVKLSLDEQLVEARFIQILLEAPVIKDYFARTSHGGTMDILNLTLLKELPIPLPPLEEQRFIVEEVERRLSVVDKLEATVEANLKQAGGLRQSILKQAFSGKLVPQNPDDEPASALLERIRAERRSADRKVKKPRGAKYDDGAQGRLI